uniref:Uncharacterized protein n=1 Tax=Glossina pallidipes TaxID=7398 RepID=A0A1A9Z0S7_GLOPL
MNYDEAIVLQQHGFQNGVPDMIYGNQATIIGSIPLIRELLKLTVKRVHSILAIAIGAPSGLEALDDFRGDDALKTPSSQKIDTNLKATLQNAEHHTKNQYHRHRIAPNKKLSNES